MNLGLFSLIFCSSFLSISFGDFQLVIVHTNDAHARIEQTNKYSADCTLEDEADDKCYGGVARTLTKIKEMRQQYPDNILVLHAGDQFQGTLWSSHYRGKEAAYFLNAMNYDIMTLGNHDFDYGIEPLKTFLFNLTFPVVVCNLRSEDTSFQESFISSHSFIIDGIKVGVIGYLTSELPSLLDQDLMKGLTLTEEIETVRQEASKLKSEGADIIIALGHSGYHVDKKLAQQVDDVDIVIGAHSHTFLYNGDPPSSEVARGNYPTVIENTSGRKALVIQEYAYSKYLGFLKVNFTDDGKVSSWEGQPILLDASVPQDPDLLVEVKEWGAVISGIKNEVVGETFVFLQGGPTCRVQECLLGNLVTDAMLWSYIKSRKPSKADGQTGEMQWSDVAVVVWNGGGIRIDISQGKVTMGDVVDALPFRNSLFMIEITGAIILQMLEHSVTGLGPDPSGRFLQMSGLKVQYDVDQPIGKRVVSVMIRCAACSSPDYFPLEKNNIYNVLLPFYLANGGDGYSFLVDENIPSKNIGTLASDALADYFIAFSPIMHERQTRIEFVKTESPTTTAKPLPSPGNQNVPLTIFVYLTYFYLSVSYISYW